MKTIFKWVYLLSLLAVIVLGLLGFSNDIVGMIFMVLGILVAIFYFDSNDIVNVAIRYLALVAVAGALGGLTFVGPYLTGIFTAVAGFLGPVVLTLLVVWFVKKYFMGSKGKK